jgi:vancomycin resistance protein YoaR
MYFVHRFFGLLQTIEADFPTQEAERLKPSHLIGTFTTYHPSGTPRVHNIQLLADTVDGTVVLPGEQFSINGISGERTCAKGYRPAGTIIRGELVDTCGGGVSQFGTTTFNAAFFAGVTLDQWKAHSFYISRYPQGREATLSYPQLDVKFTNNTDGAIVVRTSHTASSVTVSIFGQPVATTVRAQHGQPFNFKNPETQVRTTSTLHRGQERTIQAAGARGFTVDVVRIVELSGGGEDRRSIRTVYLPQHRIVERGTADPPPPPPDDDEDEDDEDDE